MRPGRRYERRGAQHSARRRCSSSRLVDDDEEDALAVARDRRSSPRAQALRNGRLASHPAIAAPAPQSSRRAAPRRLAKSKTSASTPTLRDDERRRLAADDVLVADQEDLDEIGRRSARLAGNAMRGAEQPVAEEIDVADAARRTGPSRCCARGSSAVRKCVDRPRASESAPPRPSADWRCRSDAAPASAGGAISSSGRLL